MAIAIRGTTPGTTSGTGDPTSLTLTGARQPNTNDVLIIIHCNDFYDLTNIPTPTVGGSTSGVTAITNADDGSSQAHAKSFYYVVGSTADLTVAVDETGSADEEKALIVYVLSGVDTATPIDTSANGVNGSVLAQVCPSVSPTSSNAYLICHVGSGPFNSGAYTPPGSMSETYDFVVGGSALGATGGVEQLAASGATGTRTFTSANLCRSATLTIAVKTAGAAAAVEPRVLAARPGKTWKRRFKHRQRLASVAVAGAAYTVDQTDDAGLTDTAAFDQAKVFTDSAGLTDAAVLDRAVVLTDSIGLVDATSFAQSKVFTDDAGLTDTSTVQAAKLVTVDDSAGLTDAASLIRSLVFTDSAGLADAAVLDRSLVYTDSAGLTDTSTVQLAKLVTATDDTGITDAGVSLSAEEELTDSAGLTDTTAFSLSKTQTDSAGLTDTTAVSSGRLLDITDSAGLTDTQIYSQSKVLTDSAGLTDATALAQSKVLTDSAGLTDTSAVGLQKDVAQTDSAGLTDTRLVAVSSVLTDSVGLTDSQAFTYGPGVTDDAGLTDTSTVNLQIPVVLFDGTIVGGTKSGSHLVGGGFR